MSSTSSSCSEDIIVPIQSTTCAATIDKVSNGINQDYCYRRFRPRDHHHPRTHRQTIPGWMVVSFGAVIIGLLIYVIIVNGVYNSVQHPQFLVDSFFVSPLNLTSNNQLTANWSIGILVRNSCQHMPVVFENLEVSVFYENTDQFLSKTIFDQPFRQEPGKQTRLIVQPKALLRGISHSVSATIADDRTDGVIDFDLKIHANSTYLHRGFVGGKEGSMFSIVCKNLKVRYSSDAVHGRMLQGSKKRSVR